MPNKQRYTNNVANPLLKVINADSQLMENPTSTERNLNVQLFGDDSGTVRKVAVNASGHILTDIEPDPETGLATAAKQDEQTTKLTEIDTAIDSIDGKMTKGNDDSIPAATGAQQTLIYGRNDGTGNLHAIKCGTDGNLHVFDADVAALAPITTDGTTSAQAVNIMGSEDGTNFRTILTDGNGALIVDPSKEGIVTSDGTTTALHTMMLGNYSGNLRTVKVGEGGAVNTEVDHSWDNTNQLFNSVACADGATIESSTFDLGQGVSHEIGLVEFFLDNSASVNLEVQGLTSFNGTDFYNNGASYSVNSSKASFYFSQEDVGIGAGHRYMKLSVQVGYYK